VQPVLITEATTASLKAMAAAALPCETGGILVGVRASRTVWIVGAIELGVDRSPGHYKVPGDATRPAVLQARETIDPRVGYVGEWHTHTDDSGPSSTDRMAMRAVAWFVPRPTAGGPYLLLVRQTASGSIVSGYRAKFPFLRTVDLSATGPLPPQE
jgi:hypothetical protein